MEQFIYSESLVWVPLYPRLDINFQPVLCSMWMLQNELSACFHIKYFCIHAEHIMNLVWLWDVLDFSTTSMSLIGHSTKLWGWSLLEPQPVLWTRNEASLLDMDGWHGMSSHPTVEKMMPDYINVVYCKRGLIVLVLCFCWINCYIRHW